MKHYRIWRLRTLYRELERLIREEQRKPRPDGPIIQYLKRRKLQVQDELLVTDLRLAPVKVRASRG